MPMPITRTSSIDTIAQFITVLLLFLAVLAVTYLVTRYIGGLQRGQVKGNNIEVIETVRIGQSQCVQILRVADRYLAVGIGKEEVTLLGELDKESISLPSEGSGVVQSFKDILAKKKNENNTP